MTFLVILLAVIVVAYVALNIRRLRRGRKWAFTVCQVAKEWEQGEHDKRVARRAAAGAATGSRDVPDRQASGRPAR